MARAQIGWGILGTGLTAQRFAWDLARVRGARLAAVSSRTADRAEAAARAMGAGRGVAGVEALLDLDEVDIVYIATPNHLHREHCLAAIAAGKHVLCEKPLAMTPADAIEIADAAARSGVFCMEGMWTQFIPAVTRAERLIASGAVGEPRMLVGSFGLPTRTASDDHPMPQGGALLDRGYYLISLALRFFGQPTLIAGRIVPGPGGVDLAAAATLGFGRDKTAVLTASLTDHLDNDLFFGGDAGSITLNDVTCPTLLTVKRTRRTATDFVAQDVGLKARLREGVRRAVRQSAPLARLRLLMSQPPHVLPCRGFGFVHEIEEVHARIAAGDRESIVHPLSRSIETLITIQTISQQGAACREERHDARHA